MLHVPLVGYYPNSLAELMDKSVTRHIYLHLVSILYIPDPFHLLCIKIDHY